MRKLYKIGSIVTANNVYTGMIVKISLQMNSTTYLIQQTYEDGIKSEWFADLEITSKHNKTEIIRECLENVDNLNNVK